MSFMSLVRFSPKYFNLFDAIINGTVFLTSFLDYSLLVCRNIPFSKRYVYIPEILFFADALEEMFDGLDVHLE